MSRSMPGRAGTRAESILSFRRRFLTAALASTGGRGFPLARSPERSAEPDLLSTAVLLPVIVDQLGLEACRPALSWLLSRQCASGQFADLHRPASPRSPALLTAAALRALLALLREDTAADLVRSPGERARTWLLSLLDRHAPVGVPTAELALVVAAAAESARFFSDTGARAAITRLVAALDARREASTLARERLWAARGLLDAFLHLGERPLLRSVQQEVEAMSAAEDEQGVIPGRRNGSDVFRGPIGSAVPPDAVPPAEAADPVTQAFFTTIACEIGAAPSAARGIRHVVGDVTAEGWGPDRDPSPIPGDPLAGSQVLRTALVHDALVHFVTCGEQLPVPIWSWSGDGGRSARPRRAARRPLVAFMAGERVTHAYPYLRAHSPLSRLAAGGRVDYEVGSEISGCYVMLAGKALERADVVVVQHTLTGQLTGMGAMPSIDRPRAAVICDLDDRVLEPPGAATGRATIESLLPGIMRAIGHADVVTTASAPLARVLQDRHVPGVLLVPSAIDPADWPSSDPLGRAAAAQEQRYAHRSSPLRIACVEGAASQDEHGGIVPAITEILRRHRGKVRILFLGAIPPALDGHPAVESGPMCALDYPAYARQLCEMSIDLALVPWRDNPLDRAASAITYVELSAAGIPGVYADIPPYAGVVRDGEDALLAGPDPAQWVEAVETLMADPVPRLAMASEAWVRARSEFAIDGVLPLWEHAIESAIRLRRSREQTLAKTTDQGREPADALHLSAAVPGGGR